MYDALYKGYYIKSSRAILDCSGVLSFNDYARFLIALKIGVKWKDHTME
jgi:hypothetical protein